MVPVSADQLQPAATVEDSHRALAPRRSAAVEIGNRNGQGVPVSIKFSPQNYGAVVKTLLATKSSEDDPRVLRCFDGFCL
jgi:hypothetical protein